MASVFFSPMLNAQSPFSAPSHPVQLVEKCPGKVIQVKIALDHLRRWLTSDPELVFNSREILEIYVAAPMCEKLK